MEILSPSNLITIIVTIVYVLTFATLIRGWLKLPVGTYNKAIDVSVTVVIVARNEEKNIGRTLDAILAQDYPESLLEIIVVDDHSTDNTAQLVVQYAEQHVQLLPLDLHPSINSFKKVAITKAIERATGRLILTTDADCIMGTSWLSTMVSNYEEQGAKILSGPVVFYEEVNLFERMQTLEFLFLIGLGASSIGNGNPNTCNGANLLYERSAFLEVGGFEGIDDMASGDDELLLQKMVAIFPHAVGFVKNKEALVFTYAKSTLKEFISQRRRWASKSFRYTNRSMVFTGIFFWLFNLSILVNVILGGFYVHFLILAGWQLLIKIIMEYLFMGKITNFAGRRDLLNLIPVTNLPHIIYVVFIGVASNFGKYQWKGRLVK